MTRFVSHAMIPAVRSFVICACLALPLLADEAGDGKLTLTLTETAGLRRFGYPVHVTLTLPRNVEEKDRFRLLLDKKPVPAQFRALAGNKKQVALDFSVNQAPFEKTTYTIEYGPKVEAGPEPKKGMNLERKDEGDVTVGSGEMKYLVPKDFPGILRQVQGGKTVYVKQKGLGLIFAPRNGRSR